MCIFQKRFFSLIETVVSCLIFCIVFSLFLNFVFMSFKTNILISKAEKELFEDAVFDFKIRDIIESISPPFEKAMNSSLEGEEKQLWSTIHTDINGQELFFVSRPNFVFMSGFSNYVSCRLFVENFKLKLEVSPFWFFGSDENSKSYQMIISEQVEKIYFEFYLPGLNVNESGNIVSEIVPGSFLFPRMIKLIINKKDGTQKNMFFNIYSNPFLLRVD